MPMRDFNLKRTEKEVSPELLYHTLYKMYGNELALKYFKNLTGKEYTGEIIKEPDWSDMFKSEAEENGSNL